MLENRLLILSDGLDLVKRAPRFKARQMREAIIQHLKSLHAAGITDVSSEIASEILKAREAWQRAESPAGGGGADHHPSDSASPPPRDRGGDRGAASSDSARIGSAPPAVGQSAPPIGIPAPAPVVRPPTALGQPYEARLDRESATAALQVIESEVVQCTRCPELVRNRTNTVFGVGDPAAQICFFGEGPGADEDRSGVPFVGAAGQLLDRIIAACQLRREDVYIMNTVKCRPPQNRNPLDEEVANCRHFAERQFQIVQPRIICCLGSVAARSLLQTQSSISKLRGQIHQYRGSKVVVTYHPAYLLRVPSAKKYVWEDMKMMMRELGVHL